TEPEILLLDEPLSSLDSFLRQQLGFLVRDIQQETAIPAIMVTHSWDEAIMSDRIVVLEKGKLVQEGTPREIVEQPASEEVIKLTGLSNVVVIEDKKQEGPDKENKEKKFAVLDLSSYEVLVPEEKDPIETSYGEPLDWFYFPAKIARIMEDYTGRGEYQQVVVHLESSDQYLVIKLDKEEFHAKDLKMHSKVTIAVKKEAFKRSSV
ncbi:MAG: hypothetical protein ACFFD4_31865, partial [Candidatus Odinarchaeota archaeon]